MTVLLVLVSCFITALMFTKMLSPFLQNQDDQLRFEVLDEDLKTMELLTQQKSFYVYQLQEIEGDFKSNKLTDEDYALFKRRFEREIIIIMRQLEELHGGKGWEERVQLAYEAHLGERFSLTSEPLDTHERRDKASLEGPEDTLWETPAFEQLACISCAAPIQADDRFCSKCGTTLNLETTDEDPDNAMEARS